MAKPKKATAKKKKKISKAPISAVTASTEMNDAEWKEFISHTLHGAPTSKSITIDSDGRIAEDLKSYTFKIKSDSVLTPFHIIQSLMESAAGLLRKQLGSSEVKVGGENRNVGIGAANDLPF